jgi:hypothetical protein
VTRRHGEPEHVGARAGVPLGEHAGELGDRWPEHGLGADDTLQPAERAVWSVSAARATTNPLSVLPAKRTFTRAPGTASSLSEAGTA